MKGAGMGKPLTVREQVFDKGEGGLQCPRCPSEFADANAVQDHLQRGHRLCGTCEEFHVPGEDPWHDC